MKKIGVVLILVFSVILFSCNESSENKEKKPKDTKIEEVQEVKPKVVEIVLDSKNNSEAKGKFKFTEENGNLNVYGKFWDMNPGTHGIRIRNLKENQEGKKNDLGVFRIGGAGKGGINMNTYLWCIGCKDESKNIIGKEIIIHQISDDFITNPSKTSVTKISCGGVIK